MTHSHEKTVNPKTTPFVPVNVSSKTRWTFSWYVGSRYTQSRKNSQLVSFLSAISMSGLVVGVALLVMVLSVMNGFDRDLREKILGLVPQASIYKSRGINDWPSAVETIESVKGVSSAAPFIQLNALASYRKNTTPLLLYGIDVEKEKKVSLLQSFISDASLTRLRTEANTLILGKGLADKLGIEKDARLMMISPSSKSISSSPQIGYFTVIDIIHSQTELDQAIALTQIESAAKLRGSVAPPVTINKKDNAADISLYTKSERVVADGIRLKVDDIFQAPNVAYDVLKELDATYYQSNWTRTHGNLYYAIQMSKNMVGLLMSLIVAIAAFNVVSTLIMVVVDKQGDIAILRTLGATGRTIMMSFIAQGCLIGFTGVALGVGLGCLGALGLESFVRIIESFFQVQFLKSDVYPLTYLPTEIRLSDLVQVSATAFVLTLIASLYPAWRASKVAPAEALRYE